MNTTANSLKALCGKIECNVRHGANMDYDKMDKWQQEANSYRVTLKYQGRSYSLDFWQGYGIKTEPTAECVMDCLLSDVSCSQDSFEDFCGNCGYETDSRKAEKLYKACSRTADRLKKLLGADFKTFLEAERD